MRPILTKKEKYLGFAIAVYGAAVYLILWLPHIHEKVAGVNPAQYAIEGTALAVIFAIFVGIGKRTWIGFVGLAMALGPLSRYVVLMMPAVIFAAFSGFRYLMTPKNQRQNEDGTPVVAATPAKSKAKTKGETRPTSSFSSNRITPSKARKKKGPQKPSIYGTLGKLGPQGQAGTTNDDKK
ncbi:MAG: hypothetical protein M0Z45_03455 [Actinomycetota bacterium]|nr:hypothetical protein [Actinomycetota bacterium]